MKNLNRIFEEVLTESYGSDEYVPKILDLFGLKEENIPPEVIEKIFDAVNKYKNGRINNESLMNRIFKAVGRKWTGSLEDRKISFELDHLDGYGGWTWEEYREHYNIN